MFENSTNIQRSLIIINVCIVVTLNENKLSTMGPLTYAQENATLSISVIR